MGKRELLLAAAFIIVGVAVYQFTAPPPDQSRPGWSFSGLVQHLRREVSGNRASAKVSTTTTAKAPESLREMRVIVRSGPITITGEDRADIQVVLTVTSNGFDAAEADRLAKATKVKLDEAGAMLIASVDFPREGQQRVSMDIRVPKRLGIRIDEKSGVLKVTDIAGVVLGSGRGETHITNIAGPVQVTQRGSILAISEVASLRLTTFSGTEAKISKVRGDATLTLQGGELRAEEFDGSIEIEARNTEVRIDKLEKNRRPIKINAVDGEVMLTGVQTETRIDGRGTQIRVDQATAATLSVYNEGDESIELTAPTNGFKLDAMSIDGRLTVDTGLESAGVKVLSAGSPGGESGAVRQEFRATASVRGGGPLIMLRASRGDIVLRSR